MLGPCPGRPRETKGHERRRGSPKGDGNDSLPGNRQAALDLSPPGCDEDKRVKAGPLVSSGHVARRRQPAKVMRRAEPSRQD